LEQKEKKKLGLILGRLQPLHLGHLYLMGLAFEENEIVRICIGSAQLSDPLSAAERHERLDRQLEILGYDRARYEIFELEDIASMEDWPAFLKNGCRITDETENTFYTTEDLTGSYEDGMKAQGFRIKVVARQPFYIKAPDNFYYLVSSATQIREIYKKLGVYENV
jgi:cytidyltransferase-like protein